MADLPQHRTADQQFMSIMCGLLDEQNKLLADIRDRLSDRTSDGQPASGPAGGASGGVVELKEPAAPPRADPAAARQLTEPEQPDVKAEPVKKTAPRAAQKTTAARRRSTKEKS